MKIFNRHRAIWIVLFCLNSIACNSSPPALMLAENKATEQPMFELEKSWQLTRLVTAQGMTQAYPGATLILKQGQISGNSTCNHYFGSYRVQARQLTINLGGSSQMACAEPERMTQEQRYFELLGQVASYRLAAEKLQLLNAQGKPLLIFIAAQEK